MGVRVLLWYIPITVYIQMWGSRPAGRTKGISSAEMDRDVGGGASVDHNNNWCGTRVGGRAGWTVGWASVRNKEHRSNVVGAAAVATMPPTIGEPAGNNDVSCRVRLPTRL